MSAGLTLDGLFRRAGVRNAQAPALVDPPNRAAFTDGAPRALAFAQADRAISAFAATLRSLGLSTGTIVGLQLPNTAESVIALLGIVRAGMVAAPLPVLWRRQEVAAELFPIRQICAFGDDLPDGVVPLDGVFAGGTAEPPPRRLGDVSAQVIAMTFDVTADGIAAVPHDHARLLEAGAALAEATGLALDAPIVSTIPLSSFGGLTATLMPWLIVGGALHLHHGFDADAFAAQSAAMNDGAVVLPGPALGALANAVAGSNRTVALWRAPLGAAAQTPSPNIVDCVPFEETSAIAAARGADGLPDPEVVNAAARIGKPGTVAVGAYQFGQRALDAAVAAADPTAVIAALPDALLGNRLAGHAGDAARIAAGLAARGANPLVAHAFRPRSVS